MFRSILGAILPSLVVIASCVPCLAQNQGAQPSSGNAASSSSITLESTGGFLQANFAAKNDQGNTVYKLGFMQRLDKEIARRRAADALRPIRNIPLYGFELDASPSGSGSTGSLFSGSDLANGGSLTFTFGRAYLASYLPSQHQLDTLLEYEVLQQIQVDLANPASSRSALQEDEKFLSKAIVLGDAVLNPTDPNPHGFSMAQMSGMLRQVQLRLRTALVGTAVGGPPTRPPDAPTGFEAHAGDRSVRLAWSAVNGAGGYTLYRGSSQNGEVAVPVQTGITALTYVDRDSATNPVPNDKAVYYKIVAVNSAGQSDYSKEVSAMPSNVAPEITTGVIAVAGPGYITITWTECAGAAEYYVHRSGTAGTEQYLDKSATNSYVDRTPLAGTNYYRVEARNQSGGSPLSAEVVSIPLAITTPSTPTNVTAEPALHNGTPSILVKWSLVEGATGYVIYFTTYDARGNPTEAQALVNTTHFFDDSVKDREKRSYRVIAKNLKGESATSPRVSAVGASAIRIKAGAPPRGDLIYDSLTYQATYNRNQYSLFDATKPYGKQLYKQNFDGFSGQINYNANYGGVKLPRIFGLSAGFAKQNNTDKLKSVDVTQQQTITSGADSTMQTLVGSTTKAYKGAYLVNNVITIKTDFIMYPDLISADRHAASPRSTIAIDLFTRSTIGSQGTFIYGTGLYFTQPGNPLKMIGGLNIYQNAQHVAAIDVVAGLNF